MCEYCEECNIIYSDGETDLHIDRLRNISNNINSFIRVNMRNDFIYARINFCPMCGRKLSDD